MSDALALAIAAAHLATADAPDHPAPEPLVNAVRVAVPSLDGLRGAEVAYERWIPTYRLSLAGSVQLRESATGDYTGVRAGLGAELRWYWRARALLSPHPPGSMIGWFVGGRLDVALAATRDDRRDHWLGTTVELGTMALVGYRVAPWRGLEITPSVGAGVRHDVDTSGRLPGWTRPTVALGLELGWMF